MADCLQFSVRTEREGRICRLTPVGELDIATAPVLQEAFDAVFVDGDAGKIVVDLSELAFMDSTGLHLLAKLNAACEHADRLRVINDSPAVERLFDIAGVRAYLPIITSDDDPLAPIHGSDAARSPAD
jgi:anti-sigma B factor antagonist